MIVVDTSVLVVALADDGADGAVARDRLRDVRLIAPHLIDVEVFSALRTMVSNRRLDEHRAALALDDLHAIRVRRAAHQPLLARCWELRANVTPYDALYVALAERAGVPLLTADTKLAASPGVRCEFELIA